jgi:hypothetical protein
MADSELAKAQDNGGMLQVEQKFDDSVFTEISTSSKFLPRLQMYGGSSDAVKAGLIAMAHYGLVVGKDKIDDMGPSVDIIPLAWRPKAMDISGDDIISVFNTKAEEFARIVKDSEVQDSGCMFGPEYLIWIPGLKRFATFFMASKSARREAPSMKALLGKPATLRVEYIKSKKYSWHSPQCIACSTPFRELPEDEDLERVVNDFNNPSEKEIEKVSEAETGGGRAR